MEASALGLSDQSDQKIGCPTTGGTVKRLVRGTFRGFVQLSDHFLVLYISIEGDIDEKGGHHIEAPYIYLLKHILIGQLL